MKKTKNIFPLLFLVFFMSCSVTKNLDEKQRVHVDTKITFSNPKLIHHKNKMKAEMLLLAQPKPAKNIRKFQTNVYNTFSKSKKKKGFKKWMQRKIGKAPVIYNHQKVKRSRLVLEKYLKDNGYFGSTVTLDTLEKGQKIFVNYIVNSKGQYKIRNINLPTEPSKLANVVKNNSSKSLLKTDDPYLEINFSNEQIRLVDAANNSGYINVNKDHFYFFIDSTNTENRQVDIFIKIIQPKDSTIFQRYHLNDDVVFANYSLTNSGSQNDSTQIDKFTIIQKNDIVRPKVLAEIIGGDENELFSKEKQDAALTRLLSLGIYKFVNVKFEKFYQDSTYFFNRKFYLTPALMQDVTTEFQVNTRSGNYLGIGSSATYTHKNIFRGAERLDLSLAGGVETRFGAGQNFINTVDIGFQTDLAIPDFLLPFKVRKAGGAFIPRTRFGIGYNFQRRTEFYSLSNFNLKFGYEWNELKDRRHQLYPINVSRIFVFNQTQALDDLLLINPRSARSFDDAFILGLNYNFIYNTLKTSALQRYSYLRIGFESSGNLPALVAQGINKSAVRPYEFLNLPFSQFVRADVDFRHFIPSRKVLFGGRFFGGVGVPFNNSTVLPFVKQFFSGGSGSVRAFQIRELGPGSFQSSSTGANDFLDQTGDIKLELNLEARFPLVSILEGAFFIDAGNIWLIKDVQNTRPEGVFKFDRFYKEIAIGTGLGFRLDFDFVVIRVDGSFAVRKPYVVTKNNWTFSTMDFGNKTWRSENIAWHFAIGYPF